jgi:hypothetical protein
MSMDDLGERLSEIGGLVAEDIREESDDTFLYAEAADNFVSAALFKDLGNRVICRQPSAELMSDIRELWNAAEAGKKWTVLLYTIRGDKFDASFQYEDDLIPGEFETDRRPRVLAARYGDKPIDFSDP